MLITIETINTVFWIGLAVSMLITVIVRNAQVRNWTNGVDIRVTGTVPYRPPEVRNRDIFFEGAMYVLFVIDITLFILAVSTIPTF